MSVRKQTTSKPQNHERAQQRALARKPFLHTDGKSLFSEEVDDREWVQEKK